MNIATMTPEQLAEHGIPATVAVRASWYEPVAVLACSGYGQDRTRFPS
jgi:hypothetical protein